MNSITLELRDLAIGYAANNAVKKVAEHLNAQLVSGTLTCLIGPNGIGKSTLLRTLSAFQPPMDGSVWINQKLLSDFSSKQMAKTIGVVLTEKSNLQQLTVEEVVAMGRSPYTNFWGTLSKADGCKVNQAMDAVGIRHLSKSYIQCISDGERQKVMIAKALAQETPMIFLDEPTAFLDYPSKVGIVQLLASLAHQQGKLIFFSTHDLEIAFQMADNLWLMDQSGLHTGSFQSLAENGCLSHFINRDGLYIDSSKQQIIIQEKR